MASIYNSLVSMLKKYLILISITLFAFGNVKAEYTITENCTKAWEALLNLNTETAKKFIDLEIKKNPENYYAYYLANTRDAFILKVNGSDEKYEQFADDFERRREIMDDKDVESPYYLVCESEMLLQMCIFNVLHGDRLTGVRKGFRSYKKIKENIKLHPDFVQNKKLDGFFNIAISNLPSFVRWAAGAIGVSGDSDKGFRLMHEYFDRVKDDRGINAEAALYVLLSYKLNKEPKKAFDFIRVQDSTINNKRLIKYFYANTAYRSGSNEIAYETMSNFNPDDMELFFLPYDYMMGKILLRDLDPKAGYHFNRYLKLTKKDNYFKEITYKLAVSYFIQGDTKNYNLYKEKACDEGEEITERDREVEYDCQLDYTPDIALVKCKLLLDGGYDERFAELFLKYPYNKNLNIAYRLEYDFLKARYELLLGNNQQAINGFKKIIEAGKDEDLYFASESALRLGLFYRHSDAEKSANYFEMSLDLYDSDYYEYIEEIAIRELSELEN